MSKETAINPEFFKKVRTEVAKQIRNKLRAMELDVTHMELHNSSQTQTLRVYVTLSRTTNLKALYLAEKMVCEQLEQELGLRPHAFYWRYHPEQKAAAAVAEPVAHG